MRCAQTVAQTTPNFGDVMIKVRKWVGHKYTVKSWIIIYVEDGHLA